jgi:hypothetical protein
MGLHPRTYDICKKYFQADKNIAELGAQVIYGDEWEIYQEFILETNSRI